MLIELQNAASFALLGPGYSPDGRWTLFSSLQPHGDGPLLYVPYEGDALAAARFSGPRRSLEQVEFPPPARVVPRLHDHGFLHQVSSIRDAIAQGDVYQVCLTLRASLEADELTGEQLLSLLCARGVPPFAAWVRLPDGTEFVSASPELLLAVDGRTARSEPMKGTASPGDEAALLHSEKDRAELAMITDLVRNDLTPVCVPRSVSVEEPRRVVRLPYAVQTVSVVSGQLCEGVSPLQALAALHPGGSVTGAPRLAALEKLRALEPTPRGAYCGVLGVLEPHWARFGLLIRTAQRALDTWTYGVGSGVVWDSDAERERNELEVKLRAFSL